MGWSWELGEILGIRVKVHWTFTILLAFIVLSSLTDGASLIVALASAGFVVLLFGCILLHELGHAMAARMYGIPTKDITMLPIGGVARLARMPDKPLQELVVALAGPAVNVLIAGAIFLLFWFYNATHQLLAFDGLDTRAVWQSLFYANIFLLLFNLLPAFPMDGGRVLRSLLALPLNYVTATRIAVRVGQAMAILFALFGLFASPTQPMLIVVGVFIFMGAAGEGNLVETRSKLGGLRVRDAMTTQVRALAPDDPLQVAGSVLLAGYQDDFPVARAGELIGLLRRQDLRAALSNPEPPMFVADVMQREFPVVDQNVSLQTVYQSMIESGVHSLPVIDETRVVGMISIQGIDKCLDFRHSGGNSDSDEVVNAEVVSDKG
jgi:Zn-dependent protease